jgi:hypothetical protein
MSLIWIFWIAKASSQDWRKFVPMFASDPQQNYALHKALILSQGIFGQVSDLKI